MFEALLYSARSRQDSNETLRDIRHIGIYVWKRVDHAIFERLDMERLVDKQQSSLVLTDVVADSSRIPKEGY